MTDKPTSQPRHAGRISDARGRKVTQLDPIAIYLLRQHEIIDAETLRRIASEDGVRITPGERLSLILGVVLALLVASLLVYSLIVGDFRTAPLARTSSLLLFCFFPWMYWTRAKWARFGHVAAAMLKHLRCPHCGYDIRNLPTDPADGATVCPECGCAWKLAGVAHRGARGDRGDQVEESLVRPTRNEK